MSVLGRHVSPRVVLALAAVLILAVGVLVSASGAIWGPSREIALVARGMAFYLNEEAGSPNPTITVARGERVRIRLRNQDRGMTHDFAVPALTTALDAIDWNEENEVVFTAPSSPGTYEYVCRPHRAMMRGRLIVGD